MDGRIGEKSNWSFIAEHMYGYSMTHLEIYYNNHSNKAIFDITKESKTSRKEKLLNFTVKREWPLHFLHSFHQILCEHSTYSILWKHNFYYCPYSFFSDKQQQFVNSSLGIHNYTIYAIYNIYTEEYI